MENKLLILKMFFTRVILHELTHVVLRQTLNDFNISSPQIYETKHQATSTTSCQISNMIEAGLILEQEIFSGKIDWFRSAFSPNLNLGYCSRFLDNVLNGLETSFSIESSGVVLSESVSLIMAVDYEFDPLPIITFE